MITRGYFIGEIIDELASVANQIAIRSKLGLLDLNIYSENFFKDVVNVIYGWELVNLNRDRSNEPGLDLGDEVNQVAIQVTSRSDASKVNLTLQKITLEQATKYSRFYVFVAGEKKSSYKLDSELCRKYGFKMENILDINALCRRALDLPIDKLQQLHILIRANVAKLLIDLEVPDPDTGRFPTSGFDKWEAKPEPKIGDGKKFAKWHKETVGVPLSTEDVAELQKDLNKLGRRLRRLPRVTREFLVMLFERRSPMKSKRLDSSCKWVRLGLVEREYRGAKAELMSELGLLSDEGFVDIYADDVHEYGEPEISMRIPASMDELSLSFLDYVKDKELSLRVVLGQVDLSKF